MSKKQGMTPIVQKTAMDRIKFLVNNQRKKIALAVVLFFAFLAQSDLNVWFLRIPNFEQLTVSEGKIRINRGVTRIGEVFTLVINNKNIPFNCGITGSAGSKTCVSIDKIPDYQGKEGKAWWYKAKNIGWSDDNIHLYQLEVNGKLVISYQKQIENYSSMKSDYLYPNIILLIISMIWFFLVQFANEPTTSKRNEK